jgi:hypothetical protein
MGTKSMAALEAMRTNTSLGFTDKDVDGQRNQKSCCN